MSELEDLGRYHQLCESLDSALRERNDRLSRAAGIMRTAAEAPINRHNLARRCNFDAAQRLLDEARQRHEQALLMLEELRQIAPAVGKRLPTLE